MTTDRAGNENSSDSTNGRRVAKEDGQSATLDCGTDLGFTCSIYWDRTAMAAGLVVISRCSCSFNLFRSVR